MRLHRGCKVFLASAATMLAALAQQPDGGAPLAEARKLADAARPADGQPFHHPSLTGRRETGGDDHSGPDLFAALRPLGLKLERRRSPFEVLVVDRAARPAEN